MSSLLIRRREALAALSASVSAFVLGGGVATQARAQSHYPSQPVKWIVPYPAGGGSDVTARVVSEGMRATLGQTIVIDNRPGAGTIIGTQALTGSAPDGYTISTADSGTLAYNPSLYSKLPYDIDKSFAYVGGLARMPLVLVTRPGLGVKTVKEVLEKAKADPGKLTYASAGPGTPHHVAMEMFAQQTGIKLVHVPYKGAAPAVQDLMAGQVDLMMLDMPGGISFMKSGKLPLLAVAMPARVSQLPDVPTMTEAGVPNFVAFAWQGLVAPAGTPPAVIEKLSADLTAALRNPTVQAKMTELGVEPMPMPPAEFASYARHEADRWAKVIKTAGIRLD